LDQHYQQSPVVAFGPIAESQTLGLECSLGIPTVEISTRLRARCLHVGELSVGRNRRKQLC